MKTLKGNCACTKDFTDQASLMGEIMDEFDGEFPQGLPSENSDGTYDDLTDEVQAFLKSAMERVRRETTKDVMESFPKPDGNLNNSNWEKYIEKIDEWKADLLEEIQATSPEFIRAMEKEKKTKKRIPLKDVT